MFDFHNLECVKLQKFDTTPDPKQKTKTAKTENLQIYICFKGCRWGFKQGEHQRTSLLSITLSSVPVAEVWWTYKSSSWPAGMESLLLCGAGEHFPKKQRLC